MPDARIRRAAAADLPVLTRLWQTAFGDPPRILSSLSAASGRLGR